MITSTANQKVKRLVTLKKKRKARDEEQIFLAEGLRMFREVPGDMLRELYVSEAFYEKERELVDRKAGEAGVFPEVLSEQVFSHVSDTRKNEHGTSATEPSTYGFCQHYRLFIQIGKHIDTEGNEPIERREETFHSLSFREN